MRNRISAFGLSIGICILMLMAFGANPGAAQNQPASPQQYDFSYIQVKPGMEVEFEEFMKSSIPALKQAGYTGMTVLKTSNFGMTGKYLIVTPLRTAAQMDAALAAPRSTMPVEYVSFLSAVSRIFDSMHSFMLTPQPDLNVPPKENYQFKLVVSVRIGTAPGRDADFRKGIKEVAAAIGRTNVKGVLLGKVGLGGSLDEYIMEVLYDSFTDMENNQAAMQKELAAADLTSLTGAVYYRESEMFVNLPELGIQAPAQ